MTKYAVIDIETTGLSYLDEKITYIGVGLYHGEEFIKNIVLTPKTLHKFPLVAKKLKQGKYQLVWQNGKFDTLFINHHLGALLPIHWDVMLLGTVYDLAAKHGLKDMAKNYLGVPDWDLSTKVKTSTDDAKVIPYLKKDVQYTWELFQFFIGKLSKDKMKLYHKLLRPAYLMYRDVELHGIYFDAESAKNVRKEYKKKEQEKLALLKQVADIKWTSPKQVADVLYNQLKMPVLKKTNTGSPSTDAKTLKRLVAKGYEIPKLLLEYKFYWGANSKFLNKWGDFAKHDGRIHPSFNITNVVTGRTSCSNPNLQQVPRNPELRQLYTAPEGKVLIEADYSQLELRIAADYADDETMLNVYKTAGDIHTETAKTLSGSSEPTKNDRTNAKPVNFGFLYGMQAKGFVSYAFDNYGVNFTQNQAEEYRSLFFSKYSALLPWHRSMEHVCEANGGVFNRFGRFRALPKIYAQNRWERQEAIRQAINTPVQSTGSDLLLLAASQIHSELKKKLGVQIVGTVHDSILAEIPEENAEEAIEEIKRIMENPKALEEFGVSFKIPLVADVEVGAWGSKK